ncbi:MAG: outer membrane beta-barrel protein [Proteobacteria bacterium]|nr:outer membrane beta-barrel protein [Pseudomonadota bacterium]MCP4921578.1 outer membrane beta-barrel protein [Pseudomonadota bacterium]
MSSWILLSGLAAAEPNAGGASAHPYVSIGAAFTPNVYRTRQNPVMSQAFTIRPGLDASWRTPEFKTDLGASVLRHQVVANFGENDPAENAYQLSYFDGDAYLRLQALPGRKVGFLLDSMVNQEHRPGQSGVAGAAGKTLVGSLKNDNTAQFRIQPGSALWFDLGGGARVERHTIGTAPDFSTTSTTNRVAAGPRLDVRWQFFPRTELWAHGELDWYAWTGGKLDAGMAWRAHLGVMGRITPNLRLNGVLGYAQLRSTSGISTPIQGITAMANVEWTPRANSKLALGYSKDLEDSWFTNNMSWHYVFLSYDQMLTSRLSAGLGGGTRFELYTGSVSYPDVLIKSDAHLTYQFTDHVAATLQGGFWRRASTGWDAPVEATVTARW